MGRAGFGERGRIDRDVRLVCTKLWPAPYDVLTCLARDPPELWSLPKDKAISLLPESSLLSGHIRWFHQQVREYYLRGRSVEVGLHVANLGVAFLEAARDSYQQRVRSGVP